MSHIVRHNVNEEWAHSGIIEAGNLVFVGYCVGNIGQSIENQINGAVDQLTERLESIGLTLESVVQMDCLFRDIWNIPVMEAVFKKRFNGQYPVRKSIQTEFAHRGGSDGGLLFQLDAIAFKSS
ncbi:MAG: RidA family protein [Eubacteriales bacterium]|nr:RidA family protein [Eubacteriales bacterium]MDD4462097.1 RidA family protein [Eubacteriales bacterium]